MNWCASELASLNIDRTERTHVGDDTVESAAGEAEAVLARRELPEVARGPGDGVVVQLEDDAPNGLLVCRNVELHVEVFNSAHSAVAKRNSRRRWP